ncbi:MAG: M1 family aminopeptidase [Thermoplasmata archaeon]|nr:M1 family aminopeptidase [Thermoplasmata archaeon]
MKNEIDNEYRSFPFPDYKKKYERDRQFKQIHIKAEIFPNFEKKEFSAIEEIFLEAIYADLDEIGLDAKEIEIKKLYFNEKEITYNYDGEIIKIIFSQKVRKGEKFSIKIEYKSKPVRGIFFIAPDENYPNKPYQLWTQGEDEDTRYWLPSYDYPNERTTTEMVVHVPLNYYVVSNGKLISKEKKENEIIYHYMEDFPHAIYLTSIAAGNFFVYDDEIDSVKLEYIVPYEMKDYIKKSFLNTPDMIRHFSRLFNFKYPYGKYSQVVVKDFIFGGMENINATTLTEYTLHDDRAHNDYISEGLISHELAHQWFGDFITCRDWSHAWLNEGFATYMNAVYFDHFLGHEDFLYELYQDEQAYKREDSQDYRRPIVTNIYKYPGELFDRHLYEKASRVLHMLRNEAGESSFWNFIQNYLELNGGKSIETHDLISVLQNVTGKSWEQFFDQWIYHAGHPEFNVTYSYENNKVKIKFEQTQKGIDTPETFSVPMEIAFYANNKRIVHLVRIKDRIEQFTFQMDEPEAISIDPENIILKDIKFERPKKMVIKQLELGKTVMEKINAINDLKKLSGQDVIDSLKNAILNDNFYGVKIEALHALSEIGTTSAFNALKEIGKYIIGNWDVDSRVRAAYAESLGNFFRENDALEILEKFLRVEKKYVPISKALESIGKIELETGLDILVEFKNEISWSEIVRRGMVNGLANLKDRRAKEIIYEFTKLGYDQRLRATSIIAMGKIYEHDKNVLPYLYKALKDNYFQVRAAAVQAIQNVDEKDAIPELELSYDREVDAHIKRSIRNAVTSIIQGKKETDELKNLREEIEDLKRKYKELSEKIK